MITPIIEKKKGQGSLEYLLLMGGAVLVTIIVVILITDATGSIDQSIVSSINTYENSVQLPGSLSGGGGNPPVCGNGTLETGEECDDGNTINNDTCANDCTLNPIQTCGNGTLDSGEMCDGTDFGTFGNGVNQCNAYNPLFSSGNLSCNSICEIDVSSCNTPVLCGNGMQDPGEACDSGIIFSGETCLENGYYGGPLSCNPATCQLDTGTCYPLPNFSQLQSGNFDGIIHCSGPLFNDEEHEGYLARFSENKTSMVRFNIGMYDAYGHFTLQQVIQKYKDLINAPGPYANELPYLSITYTKRNSDGTIVPFDEMVANGAFDENISMLGDMIESFGRPTFVRIASEFNGSWNGYTPEYFAASYRRIVDVIRNRTNNAIFMWNYYPGYETLDQSWYDTWYPGDDYADWWSVDLFTTHFANPTNKPHQNMIKFINDAKLHGKPMAMPESAPDGLSLDDQSTWDNWFVPYFALINDPNNNIKNFCYSNRNFALHDVQLADWGNMRIDSKNYSGTNDWLLTPLYENAISNPNYLSQPNP